MFSVSSKSDNSLIESLFSSGNTTASGSSIISVSFETVELGCTICGSIIFLGIIFTGSSFTINGV